MKNEQIHIGTLANVERVLNTKDGNPRYRATIVCDGYTKDFITKSDSDYAPYVPTLIDRKVMAFIGSHYNVPTLRSISETQMAPTVFGIVV